ncbi:hypothetical protein AOL_s00076g188 [Orbilia oligospora ATCC 24927]|uniref:Protein kinase domain-containing protein n=1 Tax=Arthrobotrys oligospora (strain ATCC 24927 / CBS 115.81 / DSM 1491) TaxID=756982 RepID=G1X981_ARTOA|nr:hypothetical protein AOL_s00076g188 [Orbilia oligospora ATCC 24927]EGX50424.1 hypothetical protein AOL_s00076g188 [Orbilia oligospora ATCC 24927]
MSTAPVPNGGFEHRTSISLVRIQTGWGEAADIDFDYNEKRVSVSLVSTDTSGSRETGYHGALAEDELINKLTQTMASEEFDEDSNYEVIDIIVNAGKEFFATIPPFLIPTSFQQQTLHSIIYPETFYLTFRTVDGNPTVTQVAAPERLLNFCSEFQIDDSLPRYSSEDIIVSKALIEHGKVTKVVINGQDMLCKAEENGIETTSLLREISSLQTIRNANSGCIRVPKLLGYVKHPFDGSIIGFLREWIPSSSFGQSLKDIKVDEAPRELREKWAVQIRQSLHELHRIGVFWGDGKPSNIIIDDNNDLWLIDFGDGWTNGWTEEMSVGTLASDRQALEKILKYLEVE